MAGKLRVSKSDCSTTGQPNGRQAELELVWSSVDWPIRPLDLNCGISDNILFLMFNVLSQRRNKGDKLKVIHQLLGYSADSEKVVSCMFRPPELVGGRVKCSIRWETTWCSPAGTACVNPLLEWNTGSSASPLVVASSVIWVTVGRTATTRPSRSTLTNWWL